MTDHDDREGEKGLLDSGDDFKGKINLSQDNQSQSAANVDF
jgi:hypothetical protein